MKNQSGFTLIELLIVIALLGALAVGLLASLDPFEQFKKGNDTGIRNTVTEIHAAAIRYYSTKNALPWKASIETVNAEDTVVKGYIQDIIDSGELKNEFLELSENQLKDIWITYVAGTTSFSVCYRPTSKNFIAEQNTKYNKDGSMDEEITDDQTTAEKKEYCDEDLETCFWCIK